MSRAGGELVDDAMRIADDATRAALGRFKQWNDEIVTGMKQAFGEDLAVENVPTKMPTGAPNSKGSNVVESRANGFPGIRIPSSNGSWDGAIGNSGWQSTKLEVIAATGGKPIPFKDGFPDFSEWSRGEVKLKNMKGNTTSDFTEADKLLAEQRGWLKPSGKPDRFRVEKFRNEEGLTWHHHQDMTTMQLVPESINNNVSHTGGASGARRANKEGK